MNDLHHISSDDLNRYHFDAIRGPELAMVEEHLLWCLYCLDREEADLRGHRKRRVHLHHISTYDLELFHLRQMTDAPAIAEIEQHVSECRECADRMLAVERFILSVQAGEIRAGSKSNDHFFISARISSISVKAAASPRR